MTMSFWPWDSAVGSPPAAVAGATVPGPLGAGWGGIRGTDDDSPDVVTEP